MESQQIIKIGKRSLRKSQGACFVTIPHVYFETVPEDIVVAMEFWMAHDGSLIMKPVKRNTTDTRNGSGGDMLE